MEHIHVRIVIIQSLLEHQITGRVCSLENNSHPPVKLGKKIDNLERKVDELLHLLRKSRA